MESNTYPSRFEKFGLTKRFDPQPTKLIKTFEANSLL